MNEGFFKYLNIAIKIIACIIVVIILWYVVCSVRGCQKAIKEITTPIEEKEDHKWGEPLPMDTKPRLFGQNDKPRIEIVIPPHEDTIRLRIPGGERVYGEIGDTELQITKIQPAIIRLKPSLHICALSDFSEVCFGLKIRFCEIWRLGLCGYIATCGPGVGCDIQLVSNISIGTVRTIDKWMLEASIKL